MSGACFCTDCGSILPVPTNPRFVTCVGCKLSVDISDRADTAVTYTIKFNDLDSYTRGSGGTQGDSAGDGAAEGPLAEKMCPQCGHPEMSYATAQLRSADEGQTIFYTCVKCRYKFSENS